MIYLVASDEGQVCKIGNSIDPFKRLTSIQTGCPYRLELKACIPGESYDERILHRMFSSHRMMGEWFKYSKAIKEYFQKPFVDFYLKTLECGLIMRNFDAPTKDLFIYLCRATYKDFHFKMTLEKRELFINEYTNPNGKKLSKSAFDKIYRVINDSHGLWKIGSAYFHVNDVMPVVEKPLSIINSMNEAEQRRFAQYHKWKQWESQNNAEIEKILTLNLN